MPDTVPSPLDRARRKMYLRLLPILFLGYMIAYVDRTNVGLTKLTMSKDLPAFNDEVIGYGAGIFFIGYLVLAIPGTLLIEKWSARKWLAWTMIAWGIVAAATSCVRTPIQFYALRFVLGLAEAGFFPGVIVYLTHWFPSRDRARTLAWFFVATPIAQIVSPKITNLMLPFGMTETISGSGATAITRYHPELWGMKGWQIVYIFWGAPAVLLGFVVLWMLTDRPRQARWLDPQEREALESELAREKHEKHSGKRMSVIEALKHPKVLLLAAAYFFIVTGNYGIEFFMPSIFDDWYHLKLGALTSMIVIPPMGSLLGQILVGWNSDRMGERRLHAALPIYVGASALLLTMFSRGNLWLTVAMFTFVMMGLKAYLPAFWTLPSLFLTESAAAGSIGFINSIGNLGGQVGPAVLGWIKHRTGMFEPGIVILGTSMMISATIILSLGLGKRVVKPSAVEAEDPLGEAVHEPV
jgi:ACS family tartrate transporter-like MFS transporter